MGLYLESLFMFMFFFMGLIFIFILNNMILLELFLMKLFLLLVMVVDGSLLFGFDIFFVSFGGFFGGINMDEIVSELSYL